MPYVPIYSNSTKEGKVIGYAYVKDGTPDYRSKPKPSLDQLDGDYFLDTTNHYNRWDQDE